VFELRFAPRTDAIVGLLPGILFAELGSDYARSETLPLASLPAQFRASDPNLRYQQQIRLTGKSSSIFVGDQVAGISVMAPYPGWDHFWPRIEQLIGVLRKSNLVARTERASLKSVNLLPSSPGQNPLTTLNLSVQLAGHDVPHMGFALRTELNDERFLRIVEIAGQATLNLPGMASRAGTLLSIDCIRSIPDERAFWDSAPKFVGEIHVELRELFFRLISEETLQSFKPIYQDT
jgi:uncharacterized protein (TIGR04255 family)